MQDNEAFSRAAERYLDTVYRAALAYSGKPETADDVTQEVFLRLFRSDRQFESEEHLRNWLIRVTVNECKRSFASRWSRMLSLDEYAEQLTFPDREAGETFQAVMSLPRKYRMVIHLYYFEGYSTAEISRLLQRPQATVCSQLARGRRKLKELLLEAENV